MGTADHGCHFMRVKLSPQNNFVRNSNKTMQMITMNHDPPANWPQIET